MDYRRPLGTIDKPGEVGLFPCDRPDLDGANGKFFDIDADQQRLNVSEATRERPESKKPTNINSWACWVFVVGRAGFEPATNGLKVPVAAANAS
jgi:hypothetical protein